MLISPGVDFLQILNPEDCLYAVGQVGCDFFVLSLAAY